MSEPIKPNIEDIYDHYGLRIIGPDRSEWRKAECPMLGHDDQNPSASVNTDENRWHCFACDFGGDSLDIISERENLAGFADVKSWAENFTQRGDRPVRDVSSRSSLLPGGKGHRPGRGNWSPPWSRL